MEPERTPLETDRGAVERFESNAPEAFPIASSPSSEGDLDLVSPRVNRLDGGSRLASLARGRPGDSHAKRGVFLGPKCRFDSNRCYRTGLWHDELGGHSSFRSRFVGSTSNSERTAAAEAGDRPGDAGGGNRFVCTAVCRTALPWAVATDAAVATIGFDEPVRAPDVQGLDDARLGVDDRAARIAVERARPVVEGGRRIRVLRRSRRSDLDRGSGGIPHEVQRRVRRGRLGAADRERRTISDRSVEADQGVVEPRGAIPVGFDRPTGVEVPGLESARRRAGTVGVKSEERPSGAALRAVSNAMSRSQEEARAHEKRRAESGRRLLGKRLVRADVPGDPRRGRVESKRATGVPSDLVGVEEKRRTAGRSAEVLTLEFTELPAFDVVLPSGLRAGAPEGLGSCGGPVTAIYRR